VIPDDWMPHRRADGEVVGYVRLAEGARFQAVDLLGRPLGEPADWLAIESLLDAHSIAWLDGTWSYAIEEGRALRVRIAEVYDARGLDLDLDDLPRGGSGTSMSDHRGFDAIDRRAQVQRRLISSGVAARGTRSCERCIAEGGIDGPVERTSDRGGEDRGDACHHVTFSSDERSGGGGCRDAAAVGAHGGHPDAFAQRPR